MYDDLRKASEVFILLCNRVKLYKLIITYHVYCNYYKIDRNKQSKITIHETDILNSHFTEHFYRQSRLTAVEQITFHDTKIKHPGNEVGISHFTRTNIDHSRLTKIPFPTLYTQRSRTSFFNTCMKKNFLFWPINVEISFNTKTRLQSWPGASFSC
jgi:hypothetical protein